MTYTTPIFDRTAQDITDRTDKAYLNVADWIRISGNTAFARALVQALLDLQIPQNTLTPPTITTIPTADEVGQFCENIERIRQATSFPPIPGLVPIKFDWQAGPSAVAPDFRNVNSWEEVVDILKNKIVLVADYRIYCGVANAGQPRFYQARWRAYPWAKDDPNFVRRARTGLAVTGAGLTFNNKFRRYG